MPARPWRFWGQLLFPAIVLAVCGCASTPRETEVISPAPYIRIAHPDAGTSDLQIAARRFEPAKRRGTTVWLVAVSHVGERAYYRDLQQLLDAQDLVLFEGVGGAPEPVDDPAEDALEKSDHLQANLAAALGLVFQFDGIDYDRPHFRNSDLTIRELQRLVAQERRGGESTGPAGAGDEFTALLDLMEGTSMMGALVNFGLNVVARSPALQAVTRLVMVETLGQLKGDLSQLQNLPPGLQRLVEVIIRERNKAVLADVESVLKRDRPPRAMAVFYGAGHMADLEVQLRRQFGYRPAEDVWLTAFGANVKETGLPESQIDWLRALVKRQLDLLEFRPQEGEPQSQPSTN